MAGPCVAVTLRSVLVLLLLLSVVVVPHVAAAALRSQAASAVSCSSERAVNSAGPSVPAHCSTRGMRLRSLASGLVAMLEKVGEPATRAVAIEQRQSEQKLVSVDAVCV